MLFLRTAAIVAAALPAAFSLPTQAAYKIPFTFNKFLALDTCSNPARFEVQNFTIWTPAAGNNASTVIDFGYLDKGTNLQTTCHFNATSRNTMPKGYTPRFACENSIVEFIWQNETQKLTMIEAACPDDTGDDRFEASGSAVPTLGCTATTCGYTYGDGNFCRANVTAIQAQFFSLQPRPGTETE
ncbi:hypothetical protein GE09DRAFT_449541 [Coniochaeta sp. 2T2.1]|nr:hypothetical protein GE09DRAFT_449541 [Coniochaeta sp. 2T2.1]